MTIKDIARLAGVSASTVSKILNNKADSIPAETQRRVLEIAREYHYTPYAGVKSPASDRRFLLSVICDMQRISPAFLQAIEKAATLLGYSVMLTGIDGNDDAELPKKLAILGKTADGILLCGRPADKRVREWISESKLPAVIVEDEDESISSFLHDWSRAGKSALEYLENLGHRRIGLLVSNRKRSGSRSLIDCVEHFCAGRGQKFDPKLIVTPDSLTRLVQTGATALLCESSEMAGLFYRFAHEQGFSLPRDISVLAFSEQDDSAFIPPLARVRLDTGDIARQSVGALIEMIEGTGPVGKQLRFTSPLGIEEADSASRALSSNGNAAPIVVVGSLNLDISMHVPTMPARGETLLIDALTTMPGGKGANQAIGVAKLGGDVSIVGRIGSDPGGKVVYNALHAAGVNTKAISVDNHIETGKAYINVMPGGESFIEVYPGANHRLTRRHLQRSEEFFRLAKYCLVQTELETKTVEWAIGLAWENHSKVICKPCSIDSINPELLAKIEILVPNEKEAARLAGAELDLDKQADFFLEQGCSQVIITLAEKGCYYKKNGEAGKLFPAYNEKGELPVDTTGASDSFISALAVCLAEGHSVETAVRFANVAAGISVCRTGVQSSLPDRITMEMHKMGYLN